MKRWLIRICVAFTTIAGSGLIYFATIGKASLIESYLSTHQERWVTQFAELPVRPEDIVFLGDSITEGGNWSELFPDQHTRNRGIGGDTTSGVLERLHQVTDGRPAKVFLLIGTNDLDRSVSDDDIVSNIIQIVDKLNAESPNTMLFVQSILPRANGYRSRIERLNNRLQIALREKAEWIDLYPLFQNPEDGSIRDDISNDELHLLGSGYLLWREVLEKYIDIPENSFEKAEMQK